MKTYCVKCSKEIIGKVKRVNGVPYCKNHVNYTKEYAEKWFAKNGKRMF